MTETPRTAPLPDMAFSVEASVDVATYAIYSGPSDDARYAQWVHRRTAALAAAHGAGVYLRARRRVAARLAPRAEFRIRARGLTPGAAAR
jgi:hypothetical protein